MKKILFLALALTLAVGGVSYADVQIDSGQAKDDVAIKFFVARNGTPTIISKDRVVVWDSTSKDGLTVALTTTSFDRLVAGVTLDLIPGISSDSVTNDVGSNNWGRVQTWGYNDGLSTQAGTVISAAGEPVCTSSTAGFASDCKAEGLGETVSSDAVMGIVLEATTDSSAAGTVALMVRCD